VGAPFAIVERSQTNFINLASTLASNPTTPLILKCISAKQKQLIFFSPVLEAIDKNNKNHSLR
jgi:hypothetical protein